MEAKISLFLSGSGSGYGYGYGYGDGSGDGSGSGSGSGDGDGDGSGDGDGDGYGYGDGSGDGYGYGSGDGDGSGYGEIIKKFKGNLVYYIDSIPCIFVAAHDTWASVEVINGEDFTLSRAFIAKQDRYFAHGETIHNAFDAVMEKVMGNMDFDEKKRTFLEKFPSFIEPYQVSDFFTWHNVMTGSCEFGRKQFAEQHGIDLDGTMSVAKFIELTSDSYGGNQIKELAAMYE